MGLNPVALYLDLERDLQSQVTARSPGPDASPRAVAADAILKSFLKKYKDSASASADTAAQDKFTECNTLCGRWDLEMSELYDDILIGGFEKAVYEFFTAVQQGTQSFNDVLMHGRFGPGASIGVSGHDFYTKSSSSPMTCTAPVLFEQYANYVEQFRTWHQAEEIRHDAFGAADIVPGSRLSFVPKNQDTSRCICIEPSLNMFYQLGLGRLIERGLKRSFGIDLATQPDKNRELARIGSLTGEYCTIDLSSASDTISLKMVRKFVPRGFLSWLELFRSPTVELPDGSRVELEMLSSMGNGYTFPFQTALFACVVSSAMELFQRKLERPRGKSLGNFAVFGDDIIVHREIYRATCRLLKLLGFVVNEEKSFSEGWFRESCGYDYFRGHNVRGVYVKSLKTPQARVVVLNRIMEWSAITGLYLPRTCSRLISSLKGTKVPLVPLYENYDAGLRLPLSRVKGLKRHRDFQSVMYTRWSPKVKKLRLSEGAVIQPRGQTARIYNPHGLILAVLHGSLEGRGISVRLHATSYGQRKAVSPNWDWLPRRGLDMPIDRWRLETAIEVNLCPSWRKLAGAKV